MYLFYDESIRENGKFIIGALVGSDNDLTKTIRAEWVKLGQDPDEFEYKSSAPKAFAPEQAKFRNCINSIIQIYAKLGLAVLPLERRDLLGNACTNLLKQLSDKGHLSRTTNHHIFSDNEITFSDYDLAQLSEINIACTQGADSVKVAGIQIADHSAHVLGSMLLEELGVLKKAVASQYPDDYKIESVPLGWELWGALRYNFFSEVEHDIDVPRSLPFAIVRGHGLYISEVCSAALSCAADKTFGTSYIGCTV